MHHVLRTNTVFAAAGIGLLALGGCATNPAPVDQIRYFSQAFNAVNTVGQPLLDDLALAERVQGRELAIRHATGKVPATAAGCSANDLPWQLAADAKSGFINGFCLSDASYFTDIADPPGTERLRGGLRVVERYAEVLSTLAEGRNLDQALGQVDALGQEVGGLLALAGGAGTAVIAPVLLAVRPLLENVAKQANADEARRLILDGSPQVTALIGALRTAAPDVFNVLVEAPSARVVKANPAPDLKLELALIETRRIAVAQYVVLLDKLQAAWVATVAAARQPQRGGQLAALVARTSELRTDAEAVRKGLAALRAAAIAGR
jgi:hypothetical protein